MATLQTLNEDVLYIICEYVSQIFKKSLDPIETIESWDMPGGLHKELTAMQSLSMTSKYLRDFTGPWIFRNTVVKARREEVMDTLCLMEKHPNMMGHVK